MTRSAFFPIWLALGAALMWGLWWLPIRALEEIGLSGMWAGSAMAAGAAPLLLISLMIRPKPARLCPGAVAGAVFTGCAIMMYSAAIADTTVLRAVLLFYLAPAWAIALECLFFGRKFRLVNGAAIGLALLGVLFIFGGEISFADWRFGDTMALFSGLAWACGAALVFNSPNAGLRALSLIACGAGAVMGALSASLFGMTLGGSGVSLQIGIGALGYGSLYVAPIILATLWSARRLSPAVLSFLLTAEIISGVGSAAILLDEPFGLPEITGAFLIAAGATLEVFAPTQVQRRG
ncbi:MAG: DMT family transporter [Paracoccaceae bacterium]